MGKSSDSDSSDIPLEPMRSNDEEAQRLMDEEEDLVLTPKPGTAQRWLNSIQPPGKPKWWKQCRGGMLIAGMTAIVLLSFVAVFSLVQPLFETSSKDASPNAAPTGSVFKNGFDMKNNWGSYSPYFSDETQFKGVEKHPIDTVFGPPKGCQYKQVHVLHRHAERLPTPDAGQEMEEVAVKLKNMTKKAYKPLQWLDNWEYKLGTALLVPIGVGTELTSGSRFWATHGRFLYDAYDREHLFYTESLNAYSNGTARPKPVIRATTQSRIKTSARSWAAGFFGVYGGQENSPKDSGDLYDLVLIPEEIGYNNTLAPYFACHLDADANTPKRANAWAQIYLKEAATRLQGILPGYENFTAIDALQLQQMCAFETAVYGSSGFCELFTETEWRGFEYAHDLGFFDSSSYGSPYGAAWGAGWVAELLARLEHRPLAGGYGTNSSYTDQIPLDQLFYLDMSHDSTIIAVLTALKLDFLEKELPVNKMPVPRQFVTSRLVPFGARLYVEVIECGDDTKVRLKLNERVLPLTGLKECGSASDGMCDYSKFVKSLRHALAQIPYDKLCAN
ncbi:hypothetical protein TRVA0_024S00210 [Trichomonascus vanleenenianus]|uniref:histidine phosphatase family protein n=1 Tax=Trichomonascus vanleenenianus TaxID=2268995 RepID=UPI003ECA3919